MWVNRPWVLLLQGPLEILLTRLALGLVVTHVVQKENMTRPWLRKLLVRLLIQAHQVLSGRLNRKRGLLVSLAALPHYFTWNWNFYHNFVEFFCKGFNEIFTIFLFFADFSSSSSNASSGVVACKAVKNQVVKQDAVVLKKAQPCPKIVSPNTRVNEGAGPSLLNTSIESNVPGSQQGEKLNSSQKKRRRDALRRKMLAHLDTLSDVDKIKQYFPSGSGPDCSLVIGRQNPYRAWSGLKKADFSTSGLIWTDSGLYEDTVKGNFFFLLILYNDILVNLTKLIYNIIFSVKLKPLSK